MNDLQLARYREQEIRELRAENAQLRKRLGENGRHARRIEQAYKDALLFAQWKAAHIDPSRDYAAYHKISQRRWQNGMALLRMARVLTNKKLWVCRDLAVIEQRLAVARQRAIESPEAYKARLNKHALGKAPSQRHRPS